MNHFFSLLIFLCFTNILSASQLSGSPSSYLPVVTPNGETLPWEDDNGIKVFHLIAEPVEREFAPGFKVNCWGYNGKTPGPTLEAQEGDTVRIIVTNKLPEPTTVHWHGIQVPNNMDGVSGLTQKPIEPGASFTYEFTLKQSGTFMYHSHFDEMTQIALGMMGFFIIHPKEISDEEKVDHDFCLMLHEWDIPVGTKTPNPNTMTDFNTFTFNSSVWPACEQLIVKTGKKVRIRLGNLSMDSHPIHLHGYEFTVVAKGAKRLKQSAQYEEVTTNVAPGTTLTFEFIADAPGDWALHCHKTHHVMSAMNHKFPNLIGTDQSKIENEMQRFLPHYMAMGNTGMGEMIEMNQDISMPLPQNTLPIGAPGPYGTIGMGGMFTILKVTDN